MTGKPIGPGINGPAGPVPIIGQKNTQPQTPMVLVEQNGQKFLYPAVAVALMADDVRTSIAALAASFILNELQNRGVIPPPEPPPDGGTPAAEETTTKGKIVTK